MSKVMIMLILILERLGIAVIGLIAAIYNEPAWALFMCVVLIILLYGTEIEIKDKKK